jgi:hypothetical protein
MMSQGLNLPVFALFGCTSIVTTCWDLSLFGMTIFPNIFLSNGPRFGEQRVGFWSSFNNPRFDPTLAIPYFLLRN